MLTNTGECFVCPSAVFPVYLGASCQSKYGPALEHKKSRKTLLSPGGAHSEKTSSWLRWLFVSIAVAKPERNMEGTSSGLRERIRNHRPRKEDLDPRKWMKHERVKAFTDIITSQHSDQDTDNSFDNKEMCEYLMKTEPANDIGHEFPLTRRLCEPK